MKTSVHTLPGSEVEIEGELPASDFEAYRAPALKRLGQTATVDGFRKGHVPEAILIEKIGQESILEEMAVLAVEKLYREILEKEKIDAIGRPDISITKLATANPLGFKIKTAVAPVVTLPDYKALAKEAGNEPGEPTEPTEGEIEAILTELRSQRKPKDATELPELNDEFAKSLGAFKDLADLREKIKGNVTLEKTERNRQKKRVAILDKISAAAEIPLPRLLIDRETDQMLAEMQYNIEGMGLNFKEYLDRIKKTSEDLRKENEGPAEKRIKVKLLLKKIGEAEQLSISPEELDAEVEKLLTYYKDVNPDRARLYAEDVLRDEKVFQYLENLK